MAIALTSLLIAAAISCGIYYLVKFHMRRRRLYELVAKFQGPTPLPVIGNALQLIGNGEHILNKLQALVRTYTSPMRMWIGPFALFVITDPEQIKVISHSPKILGKGHIFLDFCRPLFGSGLFVSPVPKWKVNRKLIQPTFNAKILDSFVEIFAAQSKLLTEQMAPNLDGPEFGILNLVSLCTLDMICETAMGVKVKAQTTRDFPFVDAVEQVISDLGKRFFHIWLHPDFVFHRTKLGKNHLKHIEFLHEFTDKVIQMKKIELLKRSSEPDAADKEEDEGESTPRREAFLDHLMKLSDEGGSEGNAKFPNSNN